MNKAMLRTIKFTLFSISAGVVEIAIFTLMNELLNLPYWPCYLTGLAASVVWNFTLNRRYTFQSANNVPVAMIKVAFFYAVFTPTSTILGSHLAEDLLWNDYLVTALNMIANFVLEYLYDRFFVYGKSIDTRTKQPLSKGRCPNLTLFIFC